MAAYIHLNSTYLLVDQTEYGESIKQWEQIMSIVKLGSI